MSGWYPAGVTGNEYEIAGPDREWSDDRVDSCQNEECEKFDEEVTVEMDLASYGYEEWATWTCSGCGKDKEYTGSVERDED